MTANQLREALDRIVTQAPDVGNKPVKVAVGGTRLEVLELVITTSAVVVKIFTGESNANASHAQ